MALIKCPNCGGKISERATKCPHCGCPVNQTGGNAPVLEEDSDASYQEASGQGKSKLWLWVTLVVILVCAIGGGAYLYLGKDGSSVPESPENQVAEDDTIAEFTSPDLAFFELHGDVSKVEWLKYDDVYNPITMLFDEEGKVIPVQDKNGIIATFFRNSDGYINQWNTGNDGEAGEEIYLYKWSNGKVQSTLDSFRDTPDNQSELDKYRFVYHYDDNGNLLKITQSYDGGEGGETKDTQIAYSDYEFDDMGNWVSRKITTVCKFRSWYEENPTWENQSSENKEYRVIKYRNHDAGVVKSIQQVQREWKTEQGIE